MVRMGFLVFPLKFVHKAHSSCELQKLLPDLCSFFHGCWNEFEPFCQEIDLVSCKFFVREVFSVFLSASIVIMRTFLAFVLSVFFALISY